MILTKNKKESSWTLMMTFKKWQTVRAYKIMHSHGGRDTNLLLMEILTEPHFLENNIDIS